MLLMLASHMRAHQPLKVPADHGTMTAVDGQPVIPDSNLIVTVDWRTVGALMRANPRIQRLDP
ncbi:MAG TPA: hypothetical protein VGH23_00035 [Rhizomicrobium sp.]